VQNDTRLVGAVPTNKRESKTRESQSLQAPGNTGKAELEPSVRKKRQGVFGLHRVKEIFGPPGAGSMRGPIDFPGAPNYVPGGSYRKVGAPRGPYTTEAYGPRPPPPVESRKIYDYSQDSREEYSQEEPDRHRSSGKSKSVS
jgi:hypothetical protein